MNSHLTLPRVRGLGTRRTPALLRFAWALALALGLLAQVRPAYAAALDLVGLDQLGLYVSRTELCAFGAVSKKAACLQSCGTPQASWNKNLDSMVDRKDYQLAFLEYQDFGTLTKICYQSGAVVPKGQCAPPSCAGTQCQDNDTDRLQAWQEALVGTSDNTAQRLCTSGAQCNGFLEQCAYQSILDLSYCQARTAVSAFHLDLVEENANEVVVAVVFDYSPVPPTVLDLYLEYDGSALVLSQSRALSAARLSGKSVEVRQATDTLLRIIALGADDARTISPGPIAELVFTRKSSSASQLQFASVPALRQASMAPTLGAQQAGLLENGAWGSSVAVKNTSDPSEGHVLLHYDFESEDRPLAQSAALKSTDVCSKLRLSSGQSILTGDCPAPPVPIGGVVDPAAKQKYERWITELDVLQRGTAITDHNVPGVNGLARWLDGVEDHLEFPLTFKSPPSASADFLEADQSFSLSFWMLQGPGAKGELVLFSRSDQSSEETKIALLSRPSASNPQLFELVWLNGGISDSRASRQVLSLPMSQGLPVNRWTHIGLNIDVRPAQPVASVYVDGVLANPTGPAGSQYSVKLLAGAVTSCAQIAQPNTKRLTIHEEGDFASVRGTGPETLYFGASGSNGLIGVEAMDTNGLGRRPIVRASSSSARDPDYNPALDRLVYANDATGNTEIWLARGDGTHARPITNGFGSASDGVFARHPRWAPDGSAIVFESNAYSVSPIDNAKALGSHLYYIAYDVQQNDVAIPLLNGGTVAQLDYQQRLASGDLPQYRLTRADEEVDNSSPQWLNGKTGNAELQLGELAFNTADRNGSHPRVRRVRVFNSYYRGADAAKELLPYLSDASGESPLIANRRLLAVRASRPAGQPSVERALLAQQTTQLVQAPEITAVVTSGGSCASGTPYKASLVYSTASSSPPLSANCWDKNGDGACDSLSEDRDGSGACDVLDCNASQLEAIFVGYNRTQTSPVMGNGVQPGAWLVSNGKKLLSKQVFGTTDSLRIEVSSQINSLPIPNGTEIASVQFCGSSPALTLTKQQTVQTFALVESKTPVNLPTVVTSSPFTLNDPRFQNINAAEFAPDVKRLALAVTFDARPMLFRTALDPTGQGVILGTGGAELITSEPVRVEGLSWSGVSRLLACNWFGAARNPSTKLFGNAFFGAIDEVKLLDHLRAEKAYLSEAQRGHERLLKDGRDGTAPVQGVACNADSDCKSSELCNSGSCGVTTCNPAPCARGRCQRLPVEIAPVEQYACVTECTSDTNCFDKQCANGPCAVCSQQTHTCGECQSVVENIGGLKLQHVQGCPDRNSFSCDRGTCVSECYSFANGQAKYMCDPATEYCRAGKCALYDWNWADISTMSLAGAGEMATTSVGRTAVVSQLYPLEITAYGASDNALAPEILVEAKAPNTFGGNWFDVGRITVHNETFGESQPLDSRYTLNVPYPITNVRVRLIAPAYANLTGGATGALRGGPSEFCSALLPNACRFVPPSSRAMLGYEAWIPGFQGKCASSDCKPEQSKFLREGVPGVIVLGVKVKGQDQLPSVGNWVNKLCRYWNPAPAVNGPVDEPVDAVTGLPNLLIFGDASREISNQKRKYYPNASATTLSNFAANSKGFAVLNCNYVDDGAVPALAGLELSVQGVTYPDPATADVIDETFGKVTENPNGCRVDLSTPTVTRSELCYEWVGGDVGMDPFASEPQPYRSITVGHFRSFGWGNAYGDNSP